MALTVEAGFGEFSKNFVDLQTDRVKTARASRDWLIGQIAKFPTEVTNFPRIYAVENPVLMGSFARRTKIRPLDDIDFMTVFSGEGSTYYAQADKVVIYVPDNASCLLRLSDNGFLNSRKMIEELKSALVHVPQYSKAEMHRNQEAATLRLSSYEWNFDIVPAFITAPRADGRTFYLIPDGSGAWQFTDPRVDARRVTEINQRHGGAVLPLIRLLKYWNNRPQMRSIPSYLLECMALDYFESRWRIGTAQDELHNLFAHVSNNIYGCCFDPSGISGDLNALDHDTRAIVGVAAYDAMNHAAVAITSASYGNHEAAIAEWRKVFGSGFPAYGGSTAS